METRDKKNILIIALLVSVVFMSVGYALLSTELRVNGGATIEDPSWDVKISNIVSTATTGTGEDLGVTTNNTLATFNAKLMEPGDSVTYTVSVTNSGNINAKLNNIQITPEDYDVGKFIVYSVDGLNANDALAAGSVKTFTVTATYNDATEEQPTEADLSRPISVLLNYVQY